MLLILQIGLSSTPGGVENCILNYNRHIDRHHYRFDYVDIYGEGLAYAAEIRALGGRIYTLPNFKKHPMSNALDLRQIINSNKYDVIHINMLSAANIIPPLIACMNSSAVVVHCHNASMPTGIVRKAANQINLKWLRNFSTMKWACGIKAGRWMWGDTFNPSDVIPNAIDVSVFKKDPDAKKKIRTVCGFSDDDIVVGFVGRLSEQKNVLFIPEILAELRKRNKKFKALVVGGGVLYDELIEKTNELNLRDIFHFTGTQNSAAKWYQAMDAFILPSLFEGLPVVGIEAQAAGLPCFMSDTITEEVNITGTVTYLPIDKGAEIWADVICNNIVTLRQHDNAFPKEYQIKYAADQLSLRYENLVLNR